MISQVFGEKQKWEQVDMEEEKDLISVEEGIRVAGLMERLDDDAMSMTIIQAILNNKEAFDRMKEFMNTDCGSSAAQFRMQFLLGMRLGTLIKTHGHIVGNQMDRAGKLAFELGMEFGKGNIGDLHEKA